eukprot:COSAG06_NODE_56055_length_286_cov_1.390374_1_plen_32_part_10
MAPPSTRTLVVPHLQQVSKNGVFAPFIYKKHH